jgi:sec-independent protein translocase protein TatB
MAAEALAGKQMFGIGPQELIIIGLLALVVFGPRRLPGMAKELGHFINEARSTVEEFKDELVPDEVDEARHAIKDIKEEARQSVVGLKAEEETELASRKEDWDEADTSRAKRSRD